MLLQYFTMVLASASHIVKLQYLTLFFTGKDIKICTNSISQSRAGSNLREQCGSIVKKPTFGIHFHT